jgi:hypothetical protein
MKIGDAIYNKEKDEYGVVKGIVIPNELMFSYSPEELFDSEGVEFYFHQLKYQPYKNGAPSGPPSLADIANVVLVVYSIWGPLTDIVETIKDWLTPDPERVAARQEARRIRKEARKHLKG